MSSPRVLIRFLTSNQVSRLYERKVLFARPTQPAMLESAIFSPRTHKRYGQNDLFQLAGIFAEKLILNHAFQDGNKRAALLAADMFLKINGYQLQANPFSQDSVNQELKEAHVAVAANTWTAAELAAYYQSIAKPVEQMTEEIEEFVLESEQL